MNIDRPHAGNEAEEDAPHKLAVALSAMQRRRCAVPEKVDQAILQAARQHLAQQQPVAHEPETESLSTGLVRLLGRIAGAIRISPAFRLSALATALVLLAFVIKSLVVPDGQSTWAAEDINHDGRVDILDAFALARQIEEKKAANPTLDRNGDGVIDRRDVELIAAHAVSLDRKGRL